MIGESGNAEPFHNSSASSVSHSEDANANTHNASHNATHNDRDADKDLHDISRDGDNKDPTDIDN